MPLVISKAYIILTIQTDPHEDRWSRLAVSSRKEDLKAASADVHDKLDDYIAFSRHNISSGVSLQNQAYKDASKQDDKLKNFSKNLSWPYFLKQ